MLVFIGTSHRLPDGPLRLSAVLDRLDQRRGKPPSFIAVEGVRAYAEQALRSEAELASRLQNELGLPAAIAQRLSRLPHYEGKVALDRSDQSPLVWLTDGLKDSTARHDHVQEYRQLLECLDPKTSVRAEDILTIHSEAELWTLSTGVDSDRESHMAECLQEAVATYLRDGSGYGVVVIGASHLRVEPGSLYDRFCSCSRRRVWCSRDWVMHFEEWIAAEHP